MTVKFCIQNLLNQAGITQSEFAERLGYAGSGNIRTALSRNDGMGMKVETLMKWLEELDCQLVVQSANNDEEYILDGEDW